MKNQNFSDDFLAAAARLCYIDRIPQQEVARMLNVSQAKVSRLLTLARKRGIVQISVSEYDPRCNDLESQLRKQFDLQDIIVLKTLGDSQDKNPAQGIGYFGSKQLFDYLKPNIKLGLAGGRTIMHVINGLLTMQVPANLTAVQLMGNVGSTPSPTDASELGRKLTTQTGTFMALNAPIFVKDKAFKQNLLQHEQIKSVMDAYSSIDIALVGVGIPENSIFASQNAISPQQINELRAKGVVGEICGHFFDKNGNECENEFKDQVISIELSSLRKISKVFAVVSSGDRSEAILGAIKGKLINALLIDETSAENLLNLTQKEINGV